MTFDNQFKSKVKNFLINKCKIKNPIEANILESCQSFYYLGRAHLRYIILKGKTNIKNR